MAHVIEQYANYVHTLLTLQTCALLMPQKQSLNLNLMYIKRCNTKECKIVQCKGLIIIFFSQIYG